MKKLIVMTVFAFAAVICTSVNSFAEIYEEGSRNSGQSCNKDVDCSGKCMCINGKCGGSDTCKTALVVGGAGAKKDNAIGGAAAGTKDSGIARGMRQKSGVKAPIDQNAGNASGAKAAAAKKAKIGEACKDDADCHSGNCRSGRCSNVSTTE